MSKLAIVGAGGHGRVVADCAVASKKYTQEDIVFIDDCYPETPDASLWPVVNNLSSLPQYIDEYDFIVAFGNNILRESTIQKLQSLSARIISLVHPSAVIGLNCNIGTGTVIFANSVVNIGASIGDGAIINTSATIDHDCIIDNYVHISPGSNVAGGVKVGKYSWLGIGCSVSQYVDIAINTQVGAGGVIIKNTQANTLYVGIPALPKKPLIPAL